MSAAPQPPGVVDLAALAQSVSLPQLLGKRLVQELDVTWGRVIGVWWLMMWRSAVAVWAIELVGGIIGYIAGFKALDEHTGFIVFGGVAAVTIWPIVIRMALRKKYEGYRIALISTLPPV